MKITKYFMMLAAAAGLAAACQPDEIVTFNPEDVTAPVLHAVSDIEITADNKDTGAAEFTWDAADFGVKSQVYYSLNMSANDVTVSLFSGVSGSSYSVSYDALNNKAFNDLGISSGEAGEVTFTLGASLAAGATYWSEPVSARVSPTSAEKVYPKLWLVGSYNGWAHDASNQFLYNFAEDDVTYQGVVDFGEDHSANEFKITGGAWGTDEHSATGAQAEEGSSVALVVGGGDNITAWKAKRYYHLTFNRTALTISKDLSFDQVGIIGLNGDWENDIVMTFHAVKQRFYADIEVADPTEFKFRMDGGWDINYGGDLKGLSSGGDNIPVEPGNYRVYFNMNNLDAITATLDTKAYGTDENASSGDQGSGDNGGNTELPEGARALNVLCQSVEGWETYNLYGWGLASTQFSWPGNAAAGMATLGGVEYAYWTLPAEDYGSSEVGLIFNNGSVQTLDIKPVTLDSDKCYKLGAAGDDGKLTYEEVATLPVIRITYTNPEGWEAVSMYGWGDLGDFGGWPGAAMTKDGDVWVYELPVEHLGKSTSLIFNNAGAGAQTVDLGPFTLTGDLVFDGNNAAVK